MARDFVNALISWQCSGHCKSKKVPNKFVSTVHGNLKGNMSCENADSCGGNGIDETAGDKMGICDIVDSTNVCKMFCNQKLINTSGKQ